MQSLEKNKDRSVLEACAQVKRLEEEGDSVYHEWVAPAVRRDRPTR